MEPEKAMTNKPKDAPNLGELRKDIDRIDEAMHGLLMERGEIIDRLISVKQTQESGSAFRPAREAATAATTPLAPICVMNGTVKPK